MKYQIDQSGKIEYTAHDTVIAVANGKQLAIKIKAKDKRYLQQVFRTMGKSQIFVIRLFSIMVFILIRDLNFNQIIIDLEYPGWDAQIKNYLLEDFHRHHLPLNPSQICFKSIGKTANAHWHAYYVFKKKHQPEILVTAKEVLNTLFH